jgi:twinkle protein
MTAGGMNLGRIVNIGAASGIGKTVFVDEIVKFIAMTSPYLVGIVSMELNSGQYGLSMLSRHIKYRISNIV